MDWEHRVLTTGPPRKFLKKGSSLYDMKIAPSSWVTNLSYKGLGQCPGLRRHSIKVYYHLLIILHYIFLPNRILLGTSWFQGHVHKKDQKPSKTPHPGLGACLSLSLHVCVCACVCVCVVSPVRLFVTLWTVANQASLSMGFSRQEYWNGSPFPPAEDLPDPRIKPEFPVSPALQADSLPTEPSKQFPKEPEPQVWSVASVLSSAQLRVKDPTELSQLRTEAWDQLLRQIW